VRPLGVPDAGPTGGQGCAQGVAEGLQPAQATSRRPGMPYPGRRDAQHHLARALRAPAQIQVVAEQRQRGVVPAESVEGGDVDEDAGGRHGQHLGRLEELTVVQLVGSDARLQLPRGVGGQAGLDHHPRVVPVEAERPDHAYRGRHVHGCEQRLQAARLRGAVVVQHPHPYRCRGEQLRSALEAAVHGGAEAGVPAGGDDGGQPACAERLGQQVGGGIRRAGVDRDDYGGGCGLPPQRRERIGQPAGPVVAHQDGGDLTAGGAGSGGCLHHATFVHLTSGCGRHPSGGTAQIAGSPAGSVGRFTRLDGRVGVGSTRRG